MQTEFLVPALGERRDIADAEIPVNALRMAQNVFRNEKGKLTIRPGYKLLVTNNPAGRVMGLGYFRTAAGSERYLAGTTTEVYQYDGTDWVDITGDALTGTNFDHVHFTTFPVSGVYKTIITNGANPDKIWNGSDAAYSNLGGSPGTSISAAVCANRLCLLQAPNKIRISDFNNPEVYPTGNGFTVLLIDAGDLMVGIESLNRTSIAVLGEESQWVGRAQSGQNPMRFERVAEESGPMSSATLVNVGFVIYYLGDDYNVYRFDGTNCQAVGWAMKPWVDENINVSNKRMAHGTYFDKIGKIFWFFPARGESGPTLGVFLDPRTGEMGRLTYGRYITAAARVRIVVTLTWAQLSGFTWENIAETYPTWESFGEPGSERRIALASADGRVFISGVGDGSDAGATIEAIWEVPLKPYAGWGSTVVPGAFETFFEQTPKSTTVELHLGHTDTMMGDLEYTLMGAFDLMTAKRNDIDLSEVREKRFVTLRHRTTAQYGAVAWNGGLFHFESTTVDTGPTGVDR